MTFELRPYGKTERLGNFKVRITEKLDGTNACVVIQDGKFVGTQSRKRIITPDSDNFGFAAWAYENAAELEKLGEGYHYGEWMGPGIQKNPLQLEEKTFFLFNTFREYPEVNANITTVPVLYDGPLFREGDVLEEVMNTLWEVRTQYATPAYTPEGIIVYFYSLRTVLKRTFKENKAKWQL